MSSSSSSHRLGPSDIAKDPDILPVPYNDSDSLRGKTDEYFWSKNLPSDNVVCTVGNGGQNTTTYLCCPPDVAIWSSSGGCRMGNTTSNTRYFHNCTLQLWIEEKPGTTAAQVNSTCLPFETYLNVTRELMRRDLSWIPFGWLTQVNDGVESVPICASVGYPQHFNYTGQCCEKLGGASSLVEGGVVKGDKYSKSPINCYPHTNDPHFEGKFTQCLDDLGTWAVCTQSLNKSGQRGTPADPNGATTATTHLGANLLVAGAALTLLV